MSSALSVDLDEALPGVRIWDVFLGCFCGLLGESGLRQRGRRFARRLMDGLKPVLFHRTTGVTHRARESSVIPCDPNELAAQVRTRMPAILEVGGYAKWLDPEASPREVLPLLRPFDAEV